MTDPFWWNLLKWLTKKILSYITALMFINDIWELGKAIKKSCFNHRFLLLYIWYVGVKKILTCNMKYVCSCWLEVKVTVAKVCYVNSCWLLTDILFDVLLLPLLCLFLYGGVGHFFIHIAIWFWKKKVSLGVNGKSYLVWL